MRVVAVGAADPFAIHLALGERSEDVNFFIDLAVRVIQVVFQKRERVMIVETIQRSMAGSDVPSVRVTGSAALQLCGGVFAFQFGQAISITTIPEH